MSRVSPRVLIVEDDIPLARSYGQVLARMTRQIETVYSGEDALKVFRELTPDLVLLDMHLPDMSGLEIIEKMTDASNPPGIVMITGEGSIARAVDAMRRGASEFLIKPVNGDKLRTALENALELRRKRNAQKQAVSEEPTETFGMIGQSAVMQPVYSILRNAAPTEAPVFITGESGTGKELCAEAIHNLSRRANGPMVALNCAAIPRDLLESEIFGHKAGAFTGATGDRQGAAMRANHGTLFLDEVCEMDLGLQAKLLRFLQTQKVSRLGDDQLHDVDVRLVCATNRDPLDEMSVGRFREDLYYRLHVVPVPVPPLRERAGDILLIARSFLKQFSDQEGRAFQDFAPTAQRALAQYGWPGNVRQLQNVMRNIVILNDAELVEPWMLPPELRSANAAGNPLQIPTPPQPIAEAVRQPQDSGPVETTRIVPLDDLIRDAIEHAIDHFNGNVTKAAAALEISPSTVYRRIDTRKSSRHSEPGQAA
ncbi:MAG: sigma-54 dependent transcriptional regulator [Pseudomonadota bacterium]